MSGLGLVSYGVDSSDESDGSDGEDNPAPAPSLAPKPPPEPLQTNEAPSVQTKSSLFASLPKPKASSGQTTDVVQRSTSGLSSSGGGDGDAPKKTSLFSSLPPPKKSAASTIEKAKPSVKPPPSSAPPPSGAASTGVSKGFLNLPQPKRKQPVKISLPALPDPDSDDDEPEDKKPKSMKGAGLFSLLPKPKTTSRKEANRTLIPYTLTKKTTPAPAPSLPKKAPAPPNAQTGTAGAKPKDPSRLNALITSYNSDDDDEDEEESKGTKGKVNFFSMEDYEKEKEAQQTASVGPPRKVSNPSGSSQGTGPQSGPAPQPDSLVGRTSAGPDPAEELTPPAVPSEQDQPLVFNPSMAHAPGYSAGHGYSYGPSNPGYAYPSNFSDPNDPSGQYATDFSNPSDSSGQFGMQDQGSSGMEYYGAAGGSGVGDVGQGGGSTSNSWQEPQQNFMQDEGFAKMVGRKNRGREEIQIIDINADDQIGPTSGLQQMVKSMTEEKEYMGKLKKEQQPTSQQKRKHQITYLARQAKERELELKNQWADNRMTRKETQAKYGF